MIKEEMSARCCGLGGKHKKVFVILSVIVLLAIAIISIAAAGWKMHERRSGVNFGVGYGNSGMMNCNNKIYPVSPNEDNQFVLPEDALKSGELAIAVSDLEIAKKAISDVATKSKGSIYATFISYASNNLKNGSIVVQVPAENFSSAFGELKMVGGRVVQEKTQQVPSRYYYPMDIAAEDKVGSVAPQQAVSSSDVNPEIAIYPNPAQTQLAQDKGYIKVVFVDYGNTSNVFAGNNFSQSSPGLWVAFGLKLLLLLVLVVLLLVMLKRIFRSLREVRAAKKAKTHHVHIVRQMPKSRQRVVRIAKKK